MCLFTSQIFVSWWMYLFIFQLYFSWHLYLIFFYKFFFFIVEFVYILGILPLIVVFWSFHNFFLSTAVSQVFFFYQLYYLFFRYLIPCTHVMVSQRRSVRDLDLYGKSAEKFLSLRPVCCMTYPPINTPSLGSSPSPLGALSQAPFPPSRAQPQTRYCIMHFITFSSN